MSQFLDTLHCKISTLSPVHIGCGEDYYPTNYVIDDGLLHHFSEEGLLSALTIAEKNGLAKLAEEQNDDGIKKLQGFIFDKREKLQFQATHSVPLSKELDSFYQSRIGKVSQRESNGRTVKNELAIARHAFNPYSQTPYVAGSSIKGAIRTALLNFNNQGNSFRFALDKKGDVQRGENDRLQKQLLDYQGISDKPEKGIKGDPLRLLKISDAIYSNAENLHSAEIRFAMNHKNKPSKFEAKGGIPQLLECLPANRSHSLDFDLTFLPDKNERARWSLRDICLACKEFFVPQLEKELAMLQSLNLCNKEWAQGLEKLLANELTDAFRENKAFLLRIGQHGGAESNTLEGVRHIKIMQGKGNAPKYTDKPTTVWLAADHKDQQKDLLPFGWVLVEIGDFKFEKTHDFLKTQATNDYALQTRLQNLEIQRSEYIAKEQQKREMQARNEAEAIENERLRVQAEEQKAAQMATMNEQQKLIFELQADFEADPNCQPNGVLNQKLVGLIKQAVNWSSEDKNDLYEFGQLLFEKWKKPKKLKEWLKTLE